MSNTRSLTRGALVAGLALLAAGPPRDPLRARLTINAPLPPPPCVFPPTLYARLLTNSLLELRWEAWALTSGRVRTFLAILQLRPDCSMH